MERLTVRDEFGNADIIGAESVEFCGCLDYEKMNKVTFALNRLAAYEDLGLEPDQIQEIDKLYKEKCEELAGVEKEQLDNIRAAIETAVDYCDSMFNCNGGVSSALKNEIIESVVAICSE